MTQYAILTDLNKCTGCLACMVACKVVNNVPIGNYWNKVLARRPQFETRCYPISRPGNVFCARAVPALSESGLRGSVSH